MMNDFVLVVNVCPVAQCQVGKFKCLINHLSPYNMMKIDNDDDQ